VLRTDARRISVVEFDWSETVGGYNNNADSVVRDRRTKYMMS